VTYRQIITTLFVSALMFALIAVWGASRAHATDLVCSYEATADRLYCRSAYLSDRAGCYDNRSFATDIGDPDGDADFAACASEAYDDYIACRADVATCE
jgi:hypothetical protein